MNGMPVASFFIEGKGDTRTIADASYKRQELVQWEVPVAVFRSSTSA
jgi:hypothetical protein